jgi:hypothetical protein
MRFPPASADDVFPYLYSKEQGTAMLIEHTARVYFELPATYKDYFNQAVRYLSSAVVHRLNFTESIIAENLKLTFKDKAIELLKMFLTHPLRVLLYLIFIIPPKLATAFGFINTQPIWDMAASTKTNTSIKRKKVIISSYDDIKNPYYAGGGAFAIHTLASRLTKNFDVLIFTGTYSGSVDEVVESVQYKRIGCSLFGPRIAQVFYQIALLRIILTQDFDIWFESFTPPFSTSCLQLFTQKPVVGLVHMLAGEDMTRKYKLPFVFFEKLGLKTYRHFVVLSQHFQEKIQLK